MKSNNFLIGALRVSAVAILLSVPWSAQAQSTTIEQEITVAPAAKATAQPLQVKQTLSEQKIAAPAPVQGNAKANGEPGTPGMAVQGEPMIMPVKGASHHQVDPEDATGNKEP
jgi:hypothetical protein